MVFTVLDGSFDIYYEYTDVNNCYNIDTFELTVVAPNADAGNDIQACVDTGLIQLLVFPLELVRGLVAELLLTEL